MNENLYKKKKRRLELLLLIAVMVCSVFTVNAEMNTQHGGLASQRLGDFIKSLEKQYQVSFVYDASQINKESIIEADKNASPLERALKQLLSSGITYKIIDNKVILKKAEPHKPQQAKDIVVRGTVTIQTKTGAETTPGIYVLEKGTKNGTATGMNGEYSIRVKDGATLVFSMIGYKSQEVPVNNRTTINVTLQEDVSALEEVVVTGYQNINRRLFTGAAVGLKGADVKQEGVVDISRMLEGRAAGVSVQNVSGTFGTAPKIRVRGATSINGDNKPLWVIDGIVLEDIVNISNDQLSSGDPTTLIGSSVAGINSDDIETFQILKDASATAQYGARAMNGVIVITTKKGKLGTPVVSYTGNFSTQAKPSYNDYNLLNSYDQMSVYSELQRKGWLNLSDVSRKANGGVYTKMYDMINTYDEASGQFLLKNDQASREAFLTRYAQSNTNWFDILFRQSLMQEHSLSISSGTDKSLLYFSTSYLNDQGAAMGNSVNRYTGNLRATFNLSKKFTLDAITTGSIRQQKAPGTVTRTGNPVEGTYNRDFDINPFSYALNTSRTTTAYDENGNLEYFRMNFAPFNILHELDNNTLDLHMLDLKFQGTATYRFNEHITNSILGAIRYVKTGREHKVTENANMALAYRAMDDATVRENNRFLYSDPDDPNALPYSILPEGGFYNTTDDYLINYNLRNTFSWNSKFNDKHSLDVTAIQELKFADRQNKFNTGYGYQFDNGGIPYISPAAIKRAVEGGLDYYGMEMKYDRYLAFSGTALYSYNRKYILQLVGRYDGSNQMGSTSTARWFPTWNISGTWNVDEEQFMEKVPAISSLRLRGGYGLTGSMGPATNSALVLQNVNTTRPYLNEIEPAINIKYLENSELTWEKQYDASMGLEVGLFKDRLNFVLEGYKRKGFDLIGSIRTSGVGGEEVKKANYADMKSHGVDVAITGIWSKNPKGISGSSTFTMGYNKNEITNLKYQPLVNDLIIPEGGPMEGHAVRGLYSVQYKGLDETGVPQFLNEKGELSENVYFQSMETAYLKYEGSVDPLYTGGLFNTISYKNFNLSALVTFQAGNKIRLYSSYSGEYSDMSALPKEFVERWVLPGDNGGPAIIDKYISDDLSDIAAYPYNAYNRSDERVADGGFVRLKQLTLGYTLPLAWSKSIGTRSLSLTLASNNVWLIYSDSKLKGQDPEFFSSGGVALPVPRQYTLSLKVGF
ncbi:TonB-linked SusC/RagA family outer membrane protein [Arcticibacter tournemirensis]|uniref:SusC/RagA family TonB-linked outer membrane protein n=1 Tax=Arcticibacter tournemirensis TaxID=699437 RepID=A0A5M9HD03_9SPHI|nr:SusC/RagA family TonB-linked outer membrane protein [Arcticibacter tournemirensis]KAA8484349.1 SusC/RagA family TonB-linked outer membrane protein [Arcticibacter tournemirensis]TQM49785.1 TonB-linked SusC/RagA family outer membrane protein [Arcticibacter tournemirensis]